MNCQVPHFPWIPPQSEMKNEHLNRRTANEDRFAPDSRLICPRIGFRSNGLQEVIAPNEDIGKPLLIDLKDHHTLPLPVIAPTSIKTGRGPFPKNVSDPHERNQMLCKGYFALECRLQIGNNQGFTMKTIKSAWKNFLQGEELPPKLRCLETIMNKYGTEETPATESYVGGNLAVLNLANERFLIHSVMEWDCALSLTRMTTNDMKNRPLEIGVKLPLDGGILYQIAVPRQSCCGNPRMIEHNDSIFATRQLHTTRLFKAEQSEDVCRPSITTIQESYDPTSTVRCIDLNPDVIGELCELRSKEIKFSQNGYLLYRKKLEIEYDSCIYMNHPKTVILNTGRKIDLLDTRCSQDESLKPVFSIENQSLRTYYNMGQNETIVCMAASSRDYISFICTESSVLVWDIRSGNRPLCKTGHFMDNSPNWIQSVQVGSNEEWLFLDSQVPTSSSMLGLSWSTQRLCLDESSDSLPIAAIEIEAKERWTTLNSLDVLHRKGLGVDWSTQNRFKQMRSGLACAKDNDGTIHIWQCNVAGDIFVQQLNINERIGSSQEKAYRDIGVGLYEWINALEENEESLSSPDHFEHSERFFADLILEETEKNLKQFSNEDLDKRQDAFSLQDSLLGLPNLFEQECPVDYTKNVEERGSYYSSVWAINEKETASQNCFPLEDTFAHDFEDELISSTPLQSTNKARPTKLDIPLSGIMMSSTPAIRKMKPNYFSTPKPLVTSTPLHINKKPFGASTPLQINKKPIGASTPLQINKKPIGASTSKFQTPSKPGMWDDF